MSTGKKLLTRRTRRDASMSNISKQRQSRTLSRTSHLPSIGPMAGSESVSRMFPSDDEPNSEMRASIDEIEAFVSAGMSQQPAGTTGFFGSDENGVSGAGSSVVLADEGPSPFMCTVCGTTLQSRTALKNHVMQQHEGKHVVKCPHCEKAFTRPSQLRKHIDSSHDERTGEFYCDKCTFKNRDIEVFNQHIHFHKVCQYCRNEFSQLSRHEPKCPYRA